MEEAMNQTKGLDEYIRTPKYREALGLPGEVTETYHLLAQGEYNRNYVFVHPRTGRRLLLRINFGSQMHLKNQIEYEYHALGLLRPSGRTPEALYVDGSLAALPYGVMVMEYLPGHALDYRTELRLAAECLADIHSVRLPEKYGLVAPESPLRAILEECEEMVKVYMDAPLGGEHPRKKKEIRAMLDMGWEKLEQCERDGAERYRCCVNTELNSTNFLINGEGKANYLIDWEKPLYGEPAQDLGHFLAPTTTFWKTDVILTEQEIEGFLDTYIRLVGERFDTGDIRERTHLYLPITCLRGITWCAMAWVQYQNPQKEIVNPSTLRKLEAYLDDRFLAEIREFLSSSMKR